jgi:DNA-binding NtrC family response regulator
MNRARRQSILIVEPNLQFREELYNFLLSDGYEQVAAIESLANTVEHLCHVAYDVILADAGVPWGSGLQVAKNLAALSPKTKIILMINAEDQQAWHQLAVQEVGMPFLIKSTFARNVLYLLEDRC